MAEHRNDLCSRILADKLLGRQSSRQGRLAFSGALCWARRALFWL